MLHTSRLLHSLWIVIAALLMSAYAGASQASEPNTCYVAQNVKPALIRAYNPSRMSSKYGSGIWIHTKKGNNYFVTNAHVVMKMKHAYANVHAIGSNNVRPYLYGKTFIHNERFDEVEAEVVAISQNSQSFVIEGRSYFSTHKDVAILKAKKMPKRFTKYLTQHKVVSNHNEVMGHIAGYRPRGRDHYKEISCYATVNTEATVLLLHSSKKAIPGQSGSALLNSNLEITGLLANSGNVHSPVNGKSGVYHLGVEDGTAYFRIGKPKNPSQNIYGFATPGYWILEILAVSP